MYVFTILLLLFSGFPSVISFLQHGSPVPPLLTGNDMVAALQACECIDLRSSSSPLLGEPKLPLRAVVIIPSDSQILTLTSLPALRSIQDEGNPDAMIEEFLIIGPSQDNARLLLGLLPLSQRSLVYWADSHSKSNAALSIVRTPRLVLLSSEPYRVTYEMPLTIQGGRSAVAGLRSALSQYEGN